MIRPVIISLAALLASCASQPPLATVGTEETLATAYEAAEDAYLTSGKATVLAVQKLQTARLALDKILAPIEAEVAAGTTPSTSDAVLLQQSVTAFGVALSDAGITLPTAGN
jgi:hypothetical protein